jgi:poly [ADP-ribose] polymerase
MITTEDGRKVAKLIMVTTDNNNKFYNMEQMPDGSLMVTYGRVDKTSVEKAYSMHEWDSIYRGKTKKGYKDMTHLRAESIIEEKVDPAAKQTSIKNLNIKMLIDKLMGYANKSVQQNYKVSSASVTQAMVDEAQKLIDILAKTIKIGADAKSLNNTLLELYSVSPRQMKDVRHHIFEPINDKDYLKVAQKKLADEQDILDTMAGQVNMITQQKKANVVAEKEHTQSSDILTQLGLVMEETDANDIKVIKQLMGPNANQFKKAFRVKNITTETKYDKHFKEKATSKEELFWHGSRNQNWFNILQTGLLIRPSGAIHTGSMFGDGIYFADKAQKSIGYTSLRGSYWASGGDNAAYLALFATNVGKQKNIKRHDSSCYSLSQAQMDKEGFDSVFAHGGIDLRNNEFIIYKAEKCTVRYIIEIGN